MNVKAIHNLARYYSGYTLTGTVRGEQVFVLNREGAEITMDLISVAALLFSLGEMLK